MVLGLDCIRNYSYVFTCGNHVFCPRLGQKAVFKFRFVLDWDKIWFAK